MGIKTNLETQKNQENQTYSVELSVVIPCLNESDTLEICLKKVTESFQKHNIKGEVIVADNGSTDGSVEIAKRCGAKIAYVKEKGYGYALDRGIFSSSGKYIVMGDADNSYDFYEIPKILEKLREGNDLVVGCRLPSGGGKVIQGAMPALHKLIGNPFFSHIARNWFKIPIHDVYCGLRGFTKNLYDRLNLRCTGMEFAVEMIIKSGLFGAKITEIPITLYPDGRKAHKPHLRTFHDGWRTLRFLLIYSPKQLFLIPGLFLVLLGTIGYSLAIPGATIGKATFDAHTLLFASLFILCGYQSMLFAFFAKTFAINEGLMPEDPMMSSIWKYVNLEKGVIAGFLLTLTGIAFLIFAVVQWVKVNFGHLDYSSTMKLVIPGAMLTALGFQTVLSSFFTSILGMQRR